jgi:phosphomannomutase
MTLDPQTQKNVAIWLEGNYDEETKKAIRKLQESDPKTLNDSFYTSLSFGTGGMRGIMGVGTNRMNQYTVRAATQGLANHLHKVWKERLSVLIGYDSRNNSKFFAEEAAKVLAANDIQVYLASELRPVPWVSFGCRLKGCQSAIMITASHNPPEYNGYKAYGRDGGQVIHPEDESIVDEVAKITDLSMVKTVPHIDHPLIKKVDKEVDEPYLYAIQNSQLYPAENKNYGNTLKIVYTSLHGTGITLMPEALSSWGFTNVSYVKKQIVPDGNFPTVKLPNPEEKEALKLGIEQMIEMRSDILIATDPDADRVGIAVMHEGEPHLMTGNQVAAVCLAHICEALTAQGKMPEKGAFIKSIGTTELFRSIAESYGRACFDVLTGFKYVAQKIREWEKDPKGYRFIFGGEESYGYLLGTHVRDKDSLISSALICEVALRLKVRGRTMIDYLHSLYAKYGFYYETLYSIKFPESKEGKAQIANGIAKMQATPLKEIGGYPIASVEDYHKSIKTDLETGKTEPITLPKENVLRFWLKDGSKLMIRPSGTEPKVKIYCGVLKRDFASIEEAEAESKKEADALVEGLKKVFSV